MNRNKYNEGAGNTNRTYKLENAIAFQQDKEKLVNLKRVSII